MKTVMQGENIREYISSMINSIRPYDQIEKDHIEGISDWIKSGEEIFRIKDAVPPKHLVSYSVVIDTSQKKVLLLDHKKAQLMLPSGGHIDRGEKPYDCAKRELLEELGISLYSVLEEKEVPFFATVTETVGINKKHTDVSLWYVFEREAGKEIDKNSRDFQRELEGDYWLSFSEILSSSVKKFDPHMHRFVQKLEKIL